jgi:hypothetical protein
MNNIDGYYHQVVSVATLMRLTVSFTGNGWAIVPLNLFPDLIAGRPVMHWGNHGLKTAELQTALYFLDGYHDGYTVSLNWDGYHTFIMVAADGYHANLTVYPRHQKGKKD